MSPKPTDPRCRPKCACVIFDATIKSTWIIPNVGRRGRRLLLHCEFLIGKWEILTSLVVVWGLHPLLLSISDKETLPEGNTFGCNITGLKEPTIKKLTLTFDLTIVSWQQLKRFLHSARKVWWTLKSFYLVHHSYMTLTFLLYCKCIKHPPRFQIELFEIKPACTNRYSTYPVWI